MAHMHSPQPAKHKQGKLFKTKGACSVKEDDDDSDSDMEELSDEFANEEFDCIDLGHGFYVVKFSSIDDGLKVVTTGTWKIMDHYLTIQKWKSEFHPAIRMIVSAVLWIQLPGLPLEYFNEEVLVKVGKIVGKPL
ncbi:hypothetical protein J1N35_021702 [Gossypium stocksii]|uniref:DUF4283 domain-containing protein n=1 Tax=Gossypium stocksii TaxID=47602 RepID=A0A9D3VEZ9_9ROSI|nr:hypothetical protein J1N35_021702 [Gossypium stocksii]